MHEMYASLLLLSCSACLTLLGPHGLWPTRLLCPWNFTGTESGVGCISSSRESSWPRDWTHISCTAGGFFTIESLGKTIFYRVLIQFERAKKTTTTTLASIQELRRPSFLSPFLSHSLIYTIFLIISIALDFIHSLWFIASTKTQRHKY